MARLAFIGLGVMGAPIARHLAAAGHDVTVYNRTEEKAAAWVAKHGGRSAATPAEAARDQDAVLTCVGNDIARRLATAAHRRGLHAVDAPVSGGQAGAENGKLSIMCGGSAEAMALAEPLMQTYAARIVHIGGPGAGQTTKMVNQIAIAGVLQGVSEAIRFAQASQLDLDKVLQAISGGAAQSWQMVNRWPTMAKDEFDFGFAIDWMRKDLGLALDEAGRNGALLPMTALIDQFYAEVQKMGGARQDTSALVRRLPK
jgi:3-hydroxyisobutyrate dehydrogenase